MLSVKQAGIKYHFLCLWYDSIRDSTPVSQDIDQQSNHKAIGSDICMFKKKERKKERKKEKRLFDINTGEIN